MEIMSFMLNSTLNKVVFGIMSLLLLETVVVAIWTERLRRKMIAAQGFLDRPKRELKAALAKNSRVTIHEVSSRVQRLIQDEVGRARGLLGTLEEAGPILGLMMTVGAFTVAVPTLGESLLTDSDLFFEKIGTATGSTFLGMMVKLIGFVQGARVDAETEALTQGLVRTDFGTATEELE